MSGSIGDNVYRASGVVAAATAAGGVSWQAVETGATFTAVAGNGYPVNTTSNACTVTLPASASVGDEIIFTDYLRTWATNNLTIDPNSLKYQGNASPDPVYDTDGQSVHIIYVDATQGWIPISDDDVTFETPQPQPAYNIDILVVAGGAGGGQYYGGGGGAGGYRVDTSLELTGGTTYTATVGAGGVGGQVGVPTDGDDSVFSGTGVTTITSAGGGQGGLSGGPSNTVGTDGGSGGGGSYNTAGGEGNVPAIPGPAVQGSDGGAGISGGDSWPCGGGGGATDVGTGGTGGPSGVGGAGGDGTANTITGPSVFYAGGGGTGLNLGTLGEGGQGGGADGNKDTDPATNAEANTGGGGGGTQYRDGIDPSNGGSGIVILSVPTTNYGTTSVTGDPTITTSGDNTVVQFLDDGTFYSG